MAHVKGGDPSQREISPTELRKHNKPNDLWIAIGGEVCSTHVVSRFESCNFDSSNVDCGHCMISEFTFC